MEMNLFPSQHFSSIQLAKKTAKTARIERIMADFRQQLLALLGGNAGNSLIQSESTVNERVIPSENGASNIVIQQRREVEREIKKVQPQLDFRSEDFCSGETIKLINKLQLLPAIPLKLDYRNIRNARCLIATAQANLGDEIEGHADFPPVVEMTVSNKWAKLLAPLVGTSDVKYVVATRCNMAEERKFADKKYATMKYDFVKTILKKYMAVCDDETVQINCEEPNLASAAVKKAIRKSSNIVSRSTYEIHRRNLILDEEKYNESMLKASKSGSGLKRKATEEVNVNDVEVVKKIVEETVNGSMTLTDDVE